MAETRNKGFLKLFSWVTLLTIQEARLLALVLGLLLLGLSVRYVNLRYEDANVKADDSIQHERTR